MKILKRLLAFGLIFSFLLTSVSYASENINSGYAGGELANSYAPHAHRTFAYPANQGIRTYLIDKNGNLASDIVDILERYPWEIDSWKDGEFGGASRAEFNKYVKQFLHAYDNTYTKMSRFAYLRGFKIEAFKNDTFVKGAVGINKIPAREDEGRASVKFIRLRDFNSIITKDKVENLVLPSNLNYDVFSAGGFVLDRILRSTVNVNGVPISGARYFLDLKLNGSYASGGRETFVMNSGYNTPLYIPIDPVKRDDVLAGRKKVSDYLATEGYKLVFEPIYYIVPEFISLVDNNNSFPYIEYLERKGFAYNYVFYGTTSSILYSLKKFINKDGKELFGDLDKVYLSGNWNIGGLGVTTYLLSQDEKIGDRVIKKFDEEPKIEGKWFTIKQLTGDYGENDVAEKGYGIMIVSVDDNRVVTSTFDYDKYSGSYQEGPAPKTSNDDGTPTPEYPSEGEDYKKVNKDHKFKIVKFYRVIDSNGNSKCISNFVRDNTVHNINIVNEGKYIVDDWFTSSSTDVPKSQNECYDSFKSSKPNDGDKGNTVGYVSIPPDKNINTLYVRYTYKEPKNTATRPSGLVLEEDELARTFRLSDIKDLFTVNYSIASKSMRGINLYINTSFERSVKFISNWTNSTYLGYKGNFKPREEDNTLAGDIEYTSVESSHASGETMVRATVPRQDLGSITPNLVFSVYRNRNTDRVTLYPKYNTSANSELTSIGISKVGYTPANDRVGKDSGSGVYSSLFKVNFTSKYKNPTYEYERWAKVKGEWEWRSDVRGSLPILDGSTNISKLNSFYNTNITTKYFLGNPNNGDSVPSNSAVKFSVGGKVFDGRKFDFVTKKLGFYPYFRMRYNTVANESNKYVFVTSVNKSSLLGLASVDSGVYKSKPSGYGIDIQSSQWSTHARTVNGLSAIIGSNKLLNKSLIPGGATMDLKSSNTSSEASEVWVGFRTYQVSLPEDSKKAYVENTGILSTDSAKKEAVKFAEEVKSVLGGYHIEKVAKTGIVKESNFKTGVSRVYPNVTFDGARLSNDAKYYLRDDRDNTSQSSKVDVINEVPLSQTVYRITLNSNTNLLNSKFGIITIEFDGNKIEGTKNTVLSNKFIKELDDRTKIITNLYDALDNGTLSSDRNGSEWYFEGNEPIEVVMSTFAYQLGFGGAYSVRSEVIDPKLTGKLENKADLLNFATDTLDEKTRTVQYRTSAGSSVAPSSGANYMGEFNGIKVRVPSMENVLTSRVHYMGNNTVKDLN